MTMTVNVIFLITYICNNYAILVLYPYIFVSKYVGNLI